MLIIAVLKVTAVETVTEFGRPSKLHPPPPPHHRPGHHLNVKWKLTEAGESQSKRKLNSYLTCIVRRCQRPFFDCIYS